MTYSGLIRCPHCDSPISHDTMVCPYCSSTAPASAPWQQGSWAVGIALLVVLLSAWTSDHYLGTRVIETIRGFFASQGG